MDVILPAAAEPTSWTLVFHRTTKVWWVRLLAFGEFKHVSAFAYLPDLKAFVLLDWHLEGIGVVVLRDMAESRRVLEDVIRGNALITMPRGEGGGCGLFCTGAMRKLLRLRCVAVRPDALYRWCIKNGGILNDDGRQAGSSQRPAVRSDAGARAGGRDDGVTKQAAG